MSSDGISVSAGTSMDLLEYPNRSALRLHEAYAEALEALGLDPDALTSCSLHDGPRGQRHRKLHCGTANAQLAGMVALGREREFVHVEQSRLVRDTESPRQALATALPPLIEWIFADGAER
jgi:hypothetical protein